VRNISSVQINYLRALLQPTHRPVKRDGIDRIARSSYSVDGLLNLSFVHGSVTLTIVRFCA
jgi:hypothetical protein